MQETTVEGIDCRRCGGEALQESSTETPGLTLPVHQSRTLSVLPSDSVGVTLKVPPLPTFAFSLPTANPLEKAPNAKFYLVDIHFYYK